MFGPKQLGLILATCSADGTIRIYECEDVMNMSQWSLRDEIPVKFPCSCISWNPSVSRLHSTMIAVASDETATGAGAATGGKVKIYEYSENIRRWQLVETFSTITEPVHDIAFAPNIGRSYHVLAVATKDLRIITLKPTSDGSKDLSGGPSKFDIRQAGQFDDHGSSVWRVCWNITGTILASSGDDGCVKMWKANYMDNWKCVSTLRASDSGQMTGNSGPVSDKTGILGFTKLSMVTSQANWH